MTVKNAVSVHATQQEGFRSLALDHIKEARDKVDPFVDVPMIDDTDAYERISKLSSAKLDALIDLLTVECITASLSCPTPFVVALADELKVNIRDFWRPEATWLSGFQKIQLSHLIVDLLGPIHAPAPEKKKSELVQVLSKLFEQAANGQLEDKSLAKKINAWLPANLRPTKNETNEKAK